MKHSYSSGGFYTGIGLAQGFLLIGAFMLHTGAGVVAIGAVVFYWAVEIFD